MFLVAGGAFVPPKSVNRTHLQDGGRIGVLLDSSIGTANSADVSGVFVSVIPFSFNAAAADYDRITIRVDANIYATAAGGTTAVTDNAFADFTGGMVGVLIGQTISTPTAQNGLVFSDNGTLCLTLIAGTDYTRGVAFDVAYCHQGTLAGGVGGCCSTTTTGFTVIGWT